MENNEEFIELDLNLIINKIWRKKIFITIVGILFSLVAFLYTTFLKQPLYSSTTKIYSISRVEDSKITIQDLMIGTGLVKDYQQIILSSDVLSKVIKSEGLDLTEEELSKKITIESPDETRVIDITVTDYNPRMASKIANAVRDNSIDVIKGITKIEDITVIEKAKVSKKPVNINVKKTIVIAFILGLIIAIAMVVTRELLDDRITTHDDIEKLNVTVLGVIPRNNKSKN